MGQTRLTTKADLHKAIYDICAKAGVDLAEQSIALCEKLTVDEVEKIINHNGDPFPYRLAKALLVTIAKTNRLEQQFSAESLNQAVKNLGRIWRTRP